MHLTDMIAYCINLDSRSDRMMKFRESQPNVLSIRRFPAVSGDLCPPCEWWTKPAGAWGCLRSHTNLIEKALNEGLSEVMVFEDDALFCEDFYDKANKFLKAVPDDWDMIYFGGNHLKRPVPIDNEVLKAIRVERTHAYVVRGDFMRVAYQALNDTPLVKEADEVFMELTDERHYKAYCPTHWLVAQGASYSDIACVDKTTRWGDDD